MMRFTTLLVLSVALCASLLDAQLSEEWRQFQEFAGRYSRHYLNDSATAQVKFSAFKQSLVRQQQLNAFEESHGGTAVFGINKFSDLTAEEFQKLYLSGLQSSFDVKSGKSSHLLNQFKTPPNKFDWRDHHPPVIGGIRNQERCGSCWAFAVVETVASAFAIQHSHSLVELSPQQLISCAYNPSAGLSGCQGGVLESAFKYLNESRTVVVSENVYPFASKDGQNHNCKSSLPNKGLILDDYIFLQNTNESHMQVLLFSISPLTTSVNAVTWQDYTGGILQHHCTGKFIDHAIQVVGYDLTGPVPYWVIRNTWGTDWGEHGYIRIKYGQNVCGLRDEVAAVYNVQSVNI